MKKSTSKKLISLLLIFTMLLVPSFVFAAEDIDVKILAESEKTTVEAGDQFLIDIVKNKSDLKFLTFRINGTFNFETAEIIAPVYTNERLGILTNAFDNEKGTFTFEGYDQTIRGTDEDVICSILFRAKKSGEFKLELEDDCMLGKHNENGFYNLSSLGTNVTIIDDTDGKNVAIIEDAEPLTPYDDMLEYDWAEKAVGVMYQLGVLEDIADMSYFPGEDITRGDFITMLVRVCRLKSSAKVEPFLDVEEDSYQYEALKIAKALGIANGSGDGKFMPDAPISRQDVASLIYRTMRKMDKVNPDIDIEKYISDFSDDDTIFEYAKEPVAGVVRAKLMVGDTSGAFRPKDNMTRAEAAVLLNRLAEFNILVSR